MPEPVVELVEALQQLADGPRKCVVLHHYAGYPTSEIASLLGISPAAARMQLTRARRRLLSLLRKDQEE